LSDEPIRGWEAALEECRPIDVIVLGAGEDELMREQSLRPFAVLLQVAGEHRSDRVYFGSGTRLVGHELPLGEGG
jgi:hypothetical protein